MGRRSCTDAQTNEPACAKLTTSVRLISQVIADVVAFRADNFWWTEAFSFRTIARSFVERQCTTSTAIGLPLARALGQSASYRFAQGGRRTIYGPSQERAAACTRCSEVGDEPGHRHRRDTATRKRKGPSIERDRRDRVRATAAHRDRGDADCQKACAEQALQPPECQVRSCGFHGPRQRLNCQLRFT